MKSVTTPYFFTHTTTTTMNVSAHRHI